MSQVRGLRTIVPYMMPPDNRQVASGAPLCALKKRLRDARLLSSFCHRTAQYLLIPSPHEQAYFRGSDIMQMTKKSFPVSMEVTKSSVQLALAQTHLSCEKCPIIGHFNTCAPYVGLYAGIKVVNSSVRPFVLPWISLSLFRSLSCDLPPTYTSSMGYLPH